MTVQIAPITQTTDTFGQWLEKTNQLITAVNNYVVSVNSNTAVGNADISGKLSAIQFVANSDGGFYAGISSANATLDTTSLLFRTSLTSNAIITASGMLINDSTLYAGSVMTMGNTVIHSANISVDNLYLSTFANVGNTFLTTSSIYSDLVNTQIFYASANGTFGDNEANTYIDRYGVIVYSQPTGTYTVNTIITSTSVSSVDVIANTVHVDNIISRTPGLPFHIKGNIEFQGANNYFDLGLNSNGDINIINGARLHVITSDPISAQPPNSNTSILLDSNNNKLIQFRNSADSGQYSGLVFSDSKQGGYVVYNSPGGSSGANSDWMSLGSYNGFKFGIGHDDTRDGIAFKGQIATTIDTHGIEIRSQNGGPNLRMRDSSAGVLAFYDPADTTSSGTYNYNITMADGEMDFNFSSTNSPYDTGDTQMILYDTGDLTVYNSLGVGTDATGNDGDIAANTIILTGTATIAKGLNVTGNTGINGSAFVNFDITAGGTIAAGNQIRAAQDIIAFTSSDRTLKTNIVNIPDALNKVSQINGVEFDWTDEHIVKYGGIDNYFNRKHDVGVIAQEVEAVLPEVVATRSDGTKAVKYDRIVALLIEAVKELKAEVDRLKNVSTK